MRFGVQVVEFRFEFFAAQRAHQSGNRQRNRRNDFVAVNQNHAAFKPNQRVDGTENFFVRGTRRNDVVRIVRDGNGNCSAFQTVAVQKSEPDFARFMVAFDDGNFANVPRRFKDEIARRVVLNVRDNFFRDDAADFNADNVNFRARQFHAQAVDGKIFHANGAAHGRNVGVFNRGQIFSVRGNKFAVNPNVRHAEIFQVVKQN